MGSNYYMETKDLELRLLILDVHSAQKTPVSLHLLSLRHTTPTFVPELHYLLMAHKMYLIP